MAEFDTLRFGRIDVPGEEQSEFRRGLLGFEQLRRFVHVEVAEEAPDRAPRVHPTQPTGRTPASALPNVEPGKRRRPQNEPDPWAGGGGQARIPCAPTG